MIFISAIVVQAIKFAPSKFLWLVASRGIVCCEQSDMPHFHQHYMDKEGKETPYKPDWLYNLPQPDGQLVYDKINEVTNTSVLSAEERKN